MKKLFTLAFILGSALVNAAEVPVLDTHVRLNQAFRTDADARFQVNSSTGEGFVAVSVIQERSVITYDPFPGGRYPYPGNQGRPRTTIERFRVFDDMVRVDGLSLVGDKVVYQGEEGDVECGTLGVSRVLKVPTIYLSGNCKLSARIVDPYYNSRVVVKLITK